MMSGLLYGVRATDPTTFVVVALVLSAVAVIASYIPARQAANVDPIVALRHE
jgi:ABC-type antimicrobial peptide transport system permease subunit